MAQGTYQYRMMTAQAAVPSADPEYLVWEPLDKSLADTVLLRTFLMDSISWYGKLELWRFTFGRHHAGA